MAVILVVSLGACSPDHEGMGRNSESRGDTLSESGNDDGHAVESTEIDPLPNPEPPLSYAAREGRVLFRHYCATCHGETGQGDGFNAFNLDPRPRDLTDETFIAGQSDQDLEDVIRGGGASVGLSTAMPPWGHTLGDRSIHYLVAYLHALPSDRE